MRVLLHETMTGIPLTELEFTEDTTWASGVNVADDVSVVVPGYTGRGQEYDALFIPRRVSLTIVEDDGLVRACGLLGIPEIGEGDDGTPRFTLPGTGIESVFDRVPVLPAAYWPIVDAENLPIPARDTRITGVEYGTMMKRLYQQAMTHPGLGLPITFEPDRSGTREKEWKADQGKPVQEAVEDISELQGGVEWDFIPRLDGADHLSWHFVSGQDSVQELTSAIWHTWQTGGSDPDVRGLRKKVSPEFLASTAIFTGGKDDDAVMVARSTSSDLIELGIPAAFVWDSSHSTVSEQSTLQGWADKRRAEGAAPVQYWEFDVRADAAPLLRHGDWCTIVVTDHWAIQDGFYDRRIVRVSGSPGGEWYQVTVVGVMTW